MRSGNPNPVEGRLAARQARKDKAFDPGSILDLRSVLWSAIERVADMLDDNTGAGYLFSDTQSYSVSLHRKSDNTVDIYFDTTSGDGTASNLIANKPLILGLNPVGLTIGDWSGAEAGYITVDAVRIGSVPEPASVCVWALVIGIGGCFGWKRGVSTLFFSSTTT